MLANADCKPGAGASFCQSNMVSYISLRDPNFTDAAGPGRPLSDYEKNVITRWANNGGPQ